MLARDFVSRPVSVSTVTCGQVLDIFFNDIASAVLTSHGAHAAMQFVNMLVMYKCCTVRYNQY